MKKCIRKLISALVTMALVMTMSVAVFAADPNPMVEAGDSKIKVTNLRHGDGIDPQTVNAYLVYRYDEQENYWKLAERFENSSLPDKVTTDAVTEDAVKDVAKTINPASDKADKTINSDTGTAEFTGLEKGLYIVLAQDPTVSGNVTYNTMIAKTYTYDQQTHLITSGSATVVAKYASTKVDKEDKDEDKAVYVGKTLEYTIKGTIIPGQTKYEITDTLKGAKYDKGSFKLTVGGKEVKPEPVFSEGEGSFTLTISNNNGEYDGAQVILTYDATVNKDAVDGGVVNEVKDTNDTTGKTTTDYTATIEVQKTDKDKYDLTGAQFALKSSKGYAKLIKEDEGTYCFTGKWVANNDNTPATVNGEGCVMDLANVSKASVKGVDVGDYTFEEVKAPKGYSINTAGGAAKVEFIDLDKNGVVSNQNELVVTNATGDNAVKDTKLSELPSTGGAGTIAFTIIGCAVMITMAGLYFGSKKRSAR